jgi:hypothetical protein
LIRAVSSQTVNWVNMGEVIFREHNHEYQADADYEGTLSNCPILFFFDKSSCIMAQVAPARPVESEAQAVQPW